MKKKLDKKMIFSVQMSMYEDFKDVCENNYKTMSEVVRDFMLQYIRGYKNVKKDNDRTVCDKS